MGGKVCWRCKGITGCCQQTFECKKFVDNAQQCFAFTYQANFPIHNLNFHWRWRWLDRMQVIFLNLFYFTAFLLVAIQIWLLQKRIQLNVWGKARQISKHTQVMLRWCELLFGIYDRDLNAINLTMFLFDHQSADYIQIPHNYVGAL